ncbi:trypsin-like serine protease [Wenzhouxiangella sp. AB-CW3]|uniref:trypsin-like serine peptidase n=1 Tax=Wenzhouxiangella sp. AB-CW3 TaxID=2771012 RepID=UPI00168B4AC8|nr:trypsin-like serine protease [Wenzhouxiangella sp. AB-CW3]QOC21808.1 trypsin-like serine protease [Wenzhouxiangella sp. AB-CW3]
MQIRKNTSVGRSPSTAAMFLVLMVMAAMGQSASLAGESDELEARSLEGRLLMDCPSAVRDYNPHRRVLQVIDGVVHRWAEYDLADGISMCVILERPDFQILSADEASELMARSSTWEVYLPDPEYWEILPPDAPELDLPPPAIESGELPGREVSPSADEPDTEYFPAESSYRGLAAPRPKYDLSTEIEQYKPRAEGGPQVVIGDEDDRVRRSLVQVQSHPWNTIGFLSQQYPTMNRYRCTAFLVGPHLALTNGHCVYNDERDDEGGTVRAAELSPGQFSAGQGEDVIRPYGTHPVYRVRLNTGWTSDEWAWHFDYAGLNLSRPFTEITTFMPLVFEDSGAQTMNTSGYPRLVHEETNEEEDPSMAQWYNTSDSTSIGGTSDRLLYHDADSSGGQSGSPLWRFISPDRRVIAVHCCGSDSSEINWGPRLVSQNQSLIENWLDWTPPGTPTLADDFGEVDLPNAGRGFMVRDNVGATRQVSEPNHCGNDDAGRSMWWTWTPPVSRPVTFTAISSDMDLILAAYRGSDLRFLNLQGCDDSAGGNNTVTFTPNFQVQHAVVVDGAEGAEGSFALEWHIEPPENDDFADALNIPGTAGARAGDNWGATSEIGESLHCGNFTDTSVWWTFPPRVDPGRLRIDTEGSNFDLLIAVYTGDAVDERTLVACDDSAGSSNEVEFATRSDERYYVAVAGVSHDQGHISLNYQWTETSIEILHDRFEVDAP